VHGSSPQLPPLLACSLNLILPHDDTDDETNNKHKNVRGLGLRPRIFMQQLRQRGPAAAHRRAQAPHCLQSPPISSPQPGPASSDAARVQAALQATCRAGHALLIPQPADAAGGR
jgi:hypothetical protein